MEEAPAVVLSQAMNSLRVNSSGRVDEPEPEPEPAVGAGAAADVAAGAEAAGLVAEGVASAAAEVAAGAEALGLEGAAPPEETPSQTLGPGIS